MIDLFYWWPPQLDKKQIKQINKFIDKNYSEIESVSPTAMVKGEKLKQDSHTKMVRWHLVKPFLHKIYNYANYTLTHDWGFLTYPYPEDKFINLTTYVGKNKDHYKWHVDQEPKDKKFDIKGTLLINVSEEKYEGGKLKIFHQGEIEVDYLDTPGSVVLFHGFINHEVTPITKGTRKIIAMFIGGPTWR